MPIDAVKTVEDLSLPMLKHSGDPRKLTNVIKKQFSDEIVYPVLSILRRGGGIDVGIFFLHGICSVELETSGKHLVDHDSDSYVVERIIYLLDHMETVYADLRTWEVNFRYAETRLFGKANGFVSGKDLSQAVQR